MIDRYTFLTKSTALRLRTPANVEGLLHPIFNDQIRNTLELSDVVCDQNHIFKSSVRGDQHILLYNAAWFY